ncbi:hypothetical protein EsH8_VI_000043 [Colletotrichum jinshuiense]
MENTHFPEDQSIRSPLPKYLATHTPASTMSYHQTGGCNASHCHVPVPQPCHHGETIGEGSRANVVPIALLDRWPALIECPGCKGVAPTNTEHMVGKGTHWMATMFFFTTAIGVFIPYVARPFKDIRHTCMRCGRKVATRRFGGGTKAHLM